ncbi:MAG TPA: hypothetical protein VN947_32585 [Polyangia bacterium]|nr:hypothetical protein [Polyangia bacterium]
MFNVNGLTPGATYVAQVTVTGYNGQPTTKRSAAFTIPRGQTNTDKVFTEVEPNDDWQYPNAVPNDGTNVFRGATSGGDNDWFHVQVPEGKSVCVAGAITNNNTTCTTGLTLYNDIQGSIAGGNGNRLLSSRSAITSSDYVCRSAPAAPYNFALVNVEAPGLVCPINYDIFIVPSRAKRQRSGSEEERLRQSSEEAVRIAALSPSRCAGHPLANVLFQLAANGRAIRGILRRVAIAAHRALGDVGGIDRFAVVFELFDDGACERFEHAQRACPVVRVHWNTRLPLRFLSDHRPHARQAPDLAHDRRMLSLATLEAW